MRLRRLAIALALLTAAVILACLAFDVLRWRSALRSGDREFARSPAAASWRANTLLPGDPARALLALQLQLRFRAAEQSFATVQAAGRGYDNGLSETRNRGELEGQLSEFARSGNEAIASASDNLLGSSPLTTRVRPARSPPHRSTRVWPTSRLRSGSTRTTWEAKFNLELLLRQLLAKGVRPDRTTATVAPRKAIAAPAAASKGVVTNRRRAHVPDPSGRLAGADGGVAAGSACARVPA